ncbi:MAG: type II toxin-antitoxin system VapB family antitoxin [Pseudomonadota bacterium]
MGINIKNDEAEEMLRAFAAEEGVGLTEAIKRAIAGARKLRSTEICGPNAYAAMLQRLNATGFMSDRKATREEMHER